MKIKEKLSGDLIVSICTDCSFKPYCRIEYCPHYEECYSDVECIYPKCEDAMAIYFDSEETEETEVSYLLRRLEEEKDSLITFDLMYNNEASDRIELFNKLIEYINKKELAAE